MESLTTFKATNILPTALRVLTVTQNASAGLFTVYLIVHLSAPISAAFASPSQSESTASSIMVLGRVLYQDRIGEIVFVYGSIGAHLLSGVGKRIIKNLLRQQKKKSVKQMAEQSLEIGEGEGDDLGAELSSRTISVATADEEAEFDREEQAHAGIETKEAVVQTPELTIYPAPVPFNAHQTTGYLLVLPLFAHIQLHRLLPAQLSPPLTPFFSYSFVAYTLSSPARIVSATSYAVLVGLATYHGIVGARILLNPVAPRSLKPSSKEKREGLMKGRQWQVAFGTVVAGVGMGLARLASEGNGVPAFMGKRYAELLRKGRMLQM